MQCCSRRRSHCDRTYEARRMRATHVGYVVIQESRDFETVCWFTPVIKKNRNGGQHLNRDARVVAFGQARLGRPAVGLNLAKHFAVFPQLRLVEIAHSAAEQRGQRTQCSVPLEI